MPGMFVPCRRLTITYPAFPAGLVLGSRLVGRDRDCSRLTGHPEVILKSRLTPLPEK